MEHLDWSWSRRPHDAVLKVLIAGCIFLLPAIAHAGTAGEISGSVSDLVTHAPIAGAGITVVSSTSRYKAVSDNTGFYAIINVFPDTYVVTASAPGYDSRTINGNTVNQDQMLTVSFALIKVVKTLARIQVTGITSLVQPTVTADQYVLNARQANLTNGSGGSASLYQIAGVINTLPGVTADPYGIPHIRAGRADEGGEEYDGIYTTNPITNNNYGGTNNVADGLARIELSTSGYGAGGGNAISGLVNVVVGRGGYPAQGNITFLDQTPTYYHGINFNYGGATPDQRFSYYLAGIWWNSDYDYGLRTATYAAAFDANYGGLTGAASPSRDQVANLVYRFGRNNKDELQWLESLGSAHYENKIRALYYPSDNPANTGNGMPTSNTPINGVCDNGIALYPGQTGCLQGTQNAADHGDRNYFINKLQLTHNFSSTSYAVFRAARVGEFLTNWTPFNDEAYRDIWYERNADMRVLTLDYANQANARHLVRLGLGRNLSLNGYIEAYVRGVGALLSPGRTLQTYEYVSDNFHPSPNLALDLGIRADQERYETIYQPSFGGSVTEPRIAFADQVNPLTVVRGSYGEYMEMPQSRTVERIGTNFPNFRDTSPANFYNGNGTISPALQPMEAKPGPTMSHAYDVSLERSLGNGWAAKISPFWRSTVNLIVDLAGIHPFAQTPQNAGLYYVNGTEFELQRQHAVDGISGWIDYTHTRALSAVPADFEQPLSVGTKKALQLLPTTFVPSDVANVVLDYQHGRLEINPEINWASGYRYGVGRTILCYGDEGGLVFGCEQAPAGVVSRQPNPAFYVNGDVNGIPIDNTEGDDPNSLVSSPTTLVNLNIYYKISARVEAGVQMQNLFANYAPIAYTANPYFTSPGAPGNGISPYGLNYGQGPYTPFSYQGSQEFLFSLTFTL